MNGNKDISGTVLMIMTTLLLAGTSVASVSQDGDGSSPMPILDAFIAGTLVNGTAGIHVEIRIMVDSDPMNPNDPFITRYFNGTTDGSGSFNITVDSNSTNEPRDYILLGNYIISAWPTYYLGLLNGTYVLPRIPEQGETLHVPYKGLEAFPEDLGNLTVRIMNASGGTPVQNAAVTIRHVSHPIPPPFALSKATDSNGEAKWTGVRTVNTSVEAKKLHFQDLSATEKDNYVTVLAGGETLAEYDLREDPWPFTTDPVNGATDVNVSRAMLVDFGRVMDRSSITDTDNYRLSEKDGPPLAITLTPAPDDRSVEVQMENALVYGTDHVLRLDTSLLTNGGGRPLWRAMEVGFRTELPPGSVHGRLIDSVSGEGAWGARLLLSDQRVRSNETGHFRFPLVPEGTYRLEVLDSYLFNATSVKGIDVDKGSEVDVGTISVNPKPWASLQVTVTSQAGVVAGATVKVLSSLLDEDELILVTGLDGKVLFDRVRAGNVNLEGSAPRHSSRIDIAVVRSGVANEFTLVLKEDELPVTVTPTLPLDKGLVDPDTDLVIHVPEEIKFQSLDVELWTLNASGERDVQLELAAPTKGSQALTYVVNIPGKLPMEIGFELVVDDTLQALDDLQLLLWRDVVYRFKTPDHPLSYVTGTVLLEGAPYAGISLDLGPFSAPTDASGVFNITVDPSSFSETYILATDLSRMGYQDVSKELTITPGKVIDAGTSVVHPIPGWYTVIPGSGATEVDPGTNVTFTFQEPVMDPGDGWDKLLKVIAIGSSAPLPGMHTISGDNRTIVFDPANDLSEGMTYRVEASSKLALQAGGPALPVGNTTSFTVRPVSLKVTLEGPEPDLLSSLPLDGTIKLGFSARVNTTMVSGALLISPTPTGLRYEWPSSSELWISAHYRSAQSLELLLPVGQYGLGKEPLRAPFSLDYTIGSTYSMPHSPESFQMVPETKWVKGSMVRITGSSPDSIGYEMTVTLRKGSTEVTHRTTVGPDGALNLTFEAPGTTGDLQVIIRIGIPGGPVAYERMFDVEVKDEQGQDGEDVIDPLFMVIAIVLVLLILAIVIGGLLYMRAQRRKLLERPDIEYSDVDADWADEE